MPDFGFARLVSLACHDLRTPLATVNGFAKTLTATARLPERETRFVELIEGAAAQMTDLLDQLGLVARIESGRYEPVLKEADTLELARSDDERVAADGGGATIETDVDAIRRALASLAHAALVHGGTEAVAWHVDARELALSPIAEGAQPVVTGESPRDLGSLVARIVIERLGGSLAADGETLRVSL